MGTGTEKEKEEEKAAFSLDDRELARMEEKFRYKREIGKARERELFGVFAEELTEEEALALRYLYAYMPLNDMADYDGSLFLAHVRHALAARKRMPWGERVPDRLFLHYVLPYRVNNENVEDYRGIIFDELAPRTEGLSMADAILETNYWCHEKATYIGSDRRTLSPLGLIRNARGRCGEESTLAVAALRSIGIPARQCYTPRWAHCDDNHAWVEAWADGEWHYIGACEPEPCLDRGWFGAPARRAMLVHTRVPAAPYEGPEPITSADEWHTELNLLDRYAPVRTLAISVRMADGTPALGAKVLFQLYNYAELATIAELQADDRGEVHFRTGYGGLAVRAVRDGMWGQIFISARDGEQFDVVLGRSGQPDGAEDFDMVPPPELPDPVTETLPEEQLRRHDERVAEGAAIRRAYEASLMDEAEASRLAADLGLPQDRVWSVLNAARGNGREIAAFLTNRSREWGEWPLRLLESLNAKDLTDTQGETLDDHLTGAMIWRDGWEEETFVRYLLCPRVHLEMLAPYRARLRSAYPEAEAAAFRADPSRLARLLNEQWESRDDLTHLRGKSTPLGTFRLKKGDAASIDLLFVALCRSLGIPARLHPEELKPQYLTAEGWKDAAVGGRSEGEAERKEPGRLLLLRDGGGDAEALAAAYGESFTMARLEDGVYRTLAYPHGQTEGFDQPLETEPGLYRITTGVRLKDGTVLGRLTYASVRAGEETRVPLTFRSAPEDLPVLGAADPAVRFRLADGSERMLGELARGTGFLVAFLEPEREPSKHLLREAGQLADAFESIGAPLVFAIGGDPQAAVFHRSAYPDLPSTSVWAGDSDHSALRSLEAAVPLGAAGFPHLFVLDEAGRIRFRQSGYKPGSGQEALQALAAIRRQ